MSAAQLGQNTATAPCELRQGRYGLFTVRLFKLDLYQIQAHLADQVGNAPGLLENAPVVIDPGLLEKLPDTEQTADLLARLRAAGLQPLAVAQGPDADPDSLQQLFGLPVIAATPLRKSATSEEPDAAEQSPSQSVAEAAEVGASGALPVAAEASTPPAQTAATTDFDDDAEHSSVAASAPAPAPGSLYVNTPVRSGQQIYAKGRDLVITAAVSAGAEVIADGCIHVYARLAGKALAGAQGNEHARIYALNFQPELVSIAGQYRLMESIPESLRGLAVEVVLDNERLDLRSIGAR